MAENTVVFQVHAEWPKEEQAELQRMIEDYSAALERANALADALAQKMLELREITIQLSEQNP